MKLLNLSLGNVSINDLYKIGSPNFSLESIYSNVNWPSSSLFKFFLFVGFNKNFFTLSNDVWILLNYKMDDLIYYYIHYYF